MAAGNAGGTQGKGGPDDDFGLPEKIREYHRHGGPQGNDHAKTLEGDIGSTELRHEHQLKKGRPDGSRERRK